MTAFRLAILLTVLPLPVPHREAQANENSKVGFRLEPEEANFDQARWRINDGLPIPPPLPDDVLPPGSPDLTKIDNPVVEKAWHKSAEALNAVPDGLHVVEFLDVQATAPASPCKPPAAQRIYVRPNLSILGVGTYKCDGAATANASAVKALSAPGLTVNITPAAAVSGGGKWRVKGEGNWRDSGATAASLSDGSHEIEFGPVTSGPCTVTPEAEVIDYYHGQQIVWTAAYAGQGCNAP
ncbi:hypothetical protein [Sphingobium phenoxybenzoativorans]|uniref:hypothetical protein n=1 Tax=Sphingobium phenoxybenzoativorans TaxID=1592790 RepID=UPI00087215B0|nr:hypothetical protein [Sphingobium phenoxybenzoativorans]